ncbi:MAG TPA: hypothetical protein VM328_13770 [Fimbriimonadaceae bacterium]|nr:hypothetical protein [Fimbriimonadaceae bacterium]
MASATTRYWEVVLQERESAGAARRMAFLSLIEKQGVKELFAVSNQPVTLGELPDRVRVAVTQELSQRFREFGFASAKDALAAWGEQGGILVRPYVTFAITYRRGDGQPFTAQISLIAPKYEPPRPR